MPYNTTAIPPRKEPTGQNQLPLSRVKKIISQDPDIHMCSNNAAFVITLATEMFIQHLASEAHTQAKLERKPRRNIQYKDVANAISHHDNLEFLEDVAPKTVPFKKAKAAAMAAQARLRGEQITDTETTNQPQVAQSSIIANGDSSKSPSHETPNGKALINGADTNPFTLSLRGEDRERERQRLSTAASMVDDPNEQLELEMRQAARPQHRDGDVDMTG